MANSQFYMVTGLGNPGKEYSQTRHNMGFLVVEELAHRHTLSFNHSRFDADIAKGTIQGSSVILVKPQSYMNRSGYPVQKISSYFKIETSNIIIVHDELDLTFGRIMIVKDRGHGGHNGIRSVIESFGTKNFIRVRVGVGRPHQGQGDNVTGHVLGKFASDEEQKKSTIINKTADACELILSTDLATAMNSINSHKID